MKIYEIEETDNLYPKQLLKIKKHPQKLYVTGNPQILNNKCIAIVGTRDSTEYGKYYAKEFAKEISRLGITVVSGLAIGIDSVCHQSSMSELGKTIAVIGSGLNNIYPEENIELAKQIIENGGAIISEYPPNVEADVSKFPIRNRIIAGLSKGVLVIEAKFRSGSSNTATHAFSQDKKVFCIPGRLGEKTGVGTNNLIKKGAYLVTNVNEILKELQEDLYSTNKIERFKENFTKYIDCKTKNFNDKRVKETKVNCKQEASVKEKRENIDAKYQPICNLLEKKPMDKNEISRILDINISDLNTRLTMMEIEGYIESMPGNYIKIKE